MVDRYAVIGNPIEHSRSPQIHAAFAEQCGEQLTYQRILGHSDRFAIEVHNFLSTGGRGLNVTVPFKGQAFDLADEHSARASTAGAVNTLIRLADGHLRGDNTDGAGLVRDLTHNHQLQLSGLRILLLGAGGAARGVLLPLLEQQPAQLTIANRTAERAQQMAADTALPGVVSGCALGQLNGRQFDLVINATAASLHGELPAIPDHLLTPGGCCYDMMYASEPTAFVRWGEAQRAALALDGLGMLVEQAAESFYLWRGVRPGTATVIAQLRNG